MNDARLTTRIVERIEDLMDEARKAMADGTITADEFALLMDGKQELYGMAMDIDEAVGLVVTMIRKGPEAPSFQRRYRERQDRKGTRPLTVKRKMMHRGVRVIPGGSGQRTA